MWRFIRTAWPLLLLVLVVETIFDIPLAYLSINPYNIPAVISLAWTVFGWTMRMLYAFCRELYGHFGINVAMRDLLAQATTEIVGIIAIAVSVWFVKVTWAIEKRVALDLWKQWKNRKAAPP